MTETASLATRLPSRQQVQRTAAEFAASLAVELLIVGVVRRRRRRRGTGRPHEHRLLHAVMDEVAAEGATELSTKRRRLLWDFERRLDAQMDAARHHH